jgi:hypothetical protein
MGVYHNLPSLRSLCTGQEDTTRDCFGLTFKAILSLLRQPVPFLGK